jgi:hypothetical protein
VAAPLSAHELLPGETERSTYGAAFHAVAADWGRRSSGAGLFAGAFGLRGLESVSGSLHLTNWRLVFSAGQGNRFIGSFAIALPDISAAENRSHGLKRALAIETADQRFEFNLWGIPRFLNALAAQRGVLRGVERERAITALAQAPVPEHRFGPRR